MSKKYYITTPIYYVNDVPHIGHAYTTVAADCLARAHRMMGEEVLFLTGTDEHGQKIETTARAEGIEPIELADRVVVRFQKLWEELEITNDDFIRTTEERHKKAVWEIFRRIGERGDIYLDKYTGWYDIREESFITETRLEEIMQLPEGSRPQIEKVEEESYFFRLSNYQEPLLEFYKNNPDFIQPTSRRNEVISFVEGGLKDLSVSRTSFSWGIPVEGNPSHVIYVWFDALANYLTAAGFPNDMEKFSEAWPADIHLVGKDILRFHAVYWPAFLMSAGLEPPKKVFAHGWWTVEGEKMSKSLGNVVDPYQIIDQYGADVFRYFLLREIPFGQDGDFSKSAIINRYNGELANNLGNLVSRSLGMMERYSGGRVPEPSSLLPEDEQIEHRALEITVKVVSHMESVSFHKALTEIWDFLATVNKYVDDTTPWTLNKEGNARRLNTVLYVLAEAIRTAAILICPFIPETAAKIWAKLGIETPLENESYVDAGKWGGIKPGALATKGDNLFPRLEVDNG